MEAAAVAGIVFATIQLVGLGVQVYQGYSAAQQDKLQSQRQEVLVRAGSFLFQDRPQSRKRPASLRQDTRTTKLFRQLLRAYKNYKSRERGGSQSPTAQGDSLEEYFREALSILNELNIPAPKQAPPSLKLETDEVLTTYYCGGAIQLQQGRSTIEDVFHLEFKDTKAPSGPDLPLRRCKECNLLVDALPAFNIDAFSNLVASSHLIACESLRKREAFYRCTICSAVGSTFDFKSSTDLQMHLLFAHPDNIVGAVAREGLDETVATAEELLDAPKFEDTFDLGATGNACTPSAIHIDKLEDSGNVAARPAISQSVSAPPPNTHLEPTIPRGSPPNGINSDGQILHPNTDARLPPSPGHVRSRTPSQVASGVLNRPRGS